jgi:hypothetical protein
MQLPHVSEKFERSSKPLRPPLQDVDWAMDVVCCSAGQGVARLEQLNKLNAGTGKCYGKWDA